MTSANPIFVMQIVVNLGNLVSVREIVGAITAIIGIVLRNMKL
ncbi:MAG: hypothetical protein ACQJCO_00685 [cyanobacterium endosymbiont of Rhopalodia sterrenbergii]